MHEIELISVTPMDDRVDGIEVRGFPDRMKTEEHPDSNGNHKSDQDCG